MRLRIPPHLLVAAILLAATFLFSANDLRAQSTTSVSEKGVAVLRNGQTMAGEISRQDNKIILRLESGSRIYLAQERVLFTAPTLSEAYWELAARTGSADLEGQVSVFQWCLRNELFEEGANHLLVLQESKIPARRLSALDLDLQAKKKRAEVRHAQAAERARKEQQIAKLKMEEKVRKERIETLIGDKTRVTIPDLHRVPRRPIHNLQQSSPEAVAVSTPTVPVGTAAATEAIDQFGNAVLSDPAPAAMVRQVSYEQPIFSAPAIAALNEGDATEDSMPQSAEPLSNAGNVRRIPKPTNQAPSIDSGFSVKKSSGAVPPVRRQKKLQSRWPIRLTQATSIGASPLRQSTISRKVVFLVASVGELPTLPKGALRVI